MTARRWRLYIRGATLNPVALADDHDGFDCILKFNEAGTWALDLAADSASAQRLAMDSNHAGGVILRRDGVSIFSGPMTGSLRETAQRDKTLTANGVDDTGLLNWRIAYPDPAAPVADYSSQAHDVRTGKADQVMAEYVDVNCGPSASSPSGHPERRFYGLVIPNTAGIGGTITGKPRFDNLLQLLQELAMQAGNLRFKILDGPNAGERALTIYETVDKSASVVFSRELGNLDSFTREEQAPAVNYAIVGGQGEGTARTIAERANTTSISAYGRMEAFADRRDTDSTTILGQALTEVLSAGAEQIGLQVLPADAGPYEFGVDYDLGDIVTVITDGEQSTGYVSEVHIRLEPSGEVTVTPTISSLLLAQPQRSGLAQTTRRLSRLERNGEGFTPNMMVQWLGAVGDKPSGWAICDGSGGTTDMRGLHPIGVGGTLAGALGDTGGSLTASSAHTHSHVHAGPSHVHTGPSHVHTGNAHGHTVPLDHDHPSFNSGLVRLGSDLRTDIAATGATEAADNHDHLIDVPAFTGSATAASGGSGDTGASGTADTGTSGTANTSADATAASATTISTLSPYRVVYFIQRTALT